jgi:copper chaperone CopZ
MEQHTLEIDGMHCEHCIAAVRSALESLEALTVQDVEVGTAEVTYDPAAITTGPAR